MSPDKITTILGGVAGAAGWFAASGLVNGEPQQVATLVAAIAAAFLGYYTNKRSV